MLCLLLALASVKPAGSGARAPFEYGSFQTGCAAVAFSTGLADSPSADGCSLLVLLRGDTVTITGPGEGTCRSRGFDSQWYPVLAADGTSGWVRGTDLAPSYIETRNGLLLFAITGRPADSLYHGAVMLVRQGGALLDSAEVLVPADHYLPSYGYCVSFRTADPAGLDRADAAAVLEFVYEACGYVNEDVLLLETGPHLVVGPYAYRAFEAGIFHYTETLVLPSHDGGSPEEVTVRAIEETFDDEAGEYVTVRTGSTAYAWSGAGFTEERQ
jgi:hypothetical protein